METQLQSPPLYLYQPDGSKQPNLDPTLWARLTQAAGRPTLPEDILDYTYALLHSPSYRQRYAELLKMDFPRIALPTSPEQFWRLVPLGTRLRQLHLLEPAALPPRTTTYPVAGSDTIEQLKYDPATKQVWINDTQYFGNVPATAWDFFIGGYQPAQKWLKDRKGSRLTNHQLDHYQTIIAVLEQTASLMTEIDTQL